MIEVVLGSPRYNYQVFLQLKLKNNANSSIKIHKSWVYDKSHVQSAERKQKAVPSRFSFSTPYDD